ncbi:MAG TPA: hypothetical protein VES42_03180 [Pilimelia sp.]|nr:hypothetical protein [Pilimelia sp.]
MSRAPIGGILMGMDTAAAPPRPAPATPGGARPTRLPLRRGGRRAVLVVHLLAIGAWIGIDVLVAVLVATGRAADDRATRAVAYQALGSFVLWPMLAAGVAALVSGVVLGLGSAYGVLRYWWVGAKLTINVVLCLLVALALRPGLREVAAYGDALAAGRPPVGDVSSLLFPPAVSLTALTLATVLSVYKPWGRITLFVRPRRPLPPGPDRPGANRPGPGRSRTRR